MLAGAAAVMAVICVAGSATGAGRTALQAISYAGLWGAPGGLVGGPCPTPGCGPYAGMYGYGTTYAAAPATAYAAANYGVASGIGGPMGGGPTLPLASVVARNAERVAANSDALLRLYQHANAGLFATNQMLLHLQNEVQAAEGTWSTVPMEFPAAYHAVPGVVAGAGVVTGLPASYSSVSTTTVSGGVGATTTTSFAPKTLKAAMSAKAAMSGANSAAQATASSPTAAAAAVNKATSLQSAAPPGFHLAWVPNAAAAAPAAAAASAWNWRPLAQASLAQAALTTPAVLKAPAKAVYTTEPTYPYISGPYRRDTRDTRVFLEYILEYSRERKREREREGRVRERVCVCVCARVRSCSLCGRMCDKKIRCEGLTLHVTSPARNCLVVLGFRNGSVLLCFGVSNWLCSGERGRTNTQASSLWKDWTHKRAAQDYHKYHDSMLSSQR